MKIVAVDLWVVNMPFDAPFESSIGTRTGTTRTVLRLTADNGLQGWGETYRGRPTAAVIERHREDLIGFNPYDIEKLRDITLMTPFYFGYVGHAAVAGIEMACYDLIGKAAGKSIAELTGGRMRDTVRITGVATPGLVPPGTTGDPALAIANATKAFADRHGFTALKMKGSNDPRFDVEMMHAVRDVLPDIDLRIDPNAAWSVIDSIWAGRELMKLNLEYLEDPCKGIEGMARVRNTVGIPLCTNMCVVQLDQVAPALRLGAVDVIHGDVHMWGGINPSKRLAAVCDAFGITMNLHSSGELGLSTACHLQLVSSTPEIQHAIDSVTYMMADDIITRPFKLENGTWTVPEGPGLGVEVDLDKLEHYAALNAQDGDLFR